MEAKKPNLFASPYAQPAREVVQLTDPQDPEWGMTIELQAPDAITEYLGDSLALEMQARYLDGDPAIGLKPQPFVVQGKTVRTVPQFWEDVAYICALQPEDTTLPFPGYEPEEIACLAFTRRAAWRQLGAAVRRMQKAGAEALPNA